ncbi:MAG: hypothetical protein R3A13_01015 [Bdellovibrionota bacterium]
MKTTSKLTLCLVACLSLACARNQVTPGPDKQGTRAIESSMLGAGAGAITGAQVSAATGPGAVVGAGVGFVAGAIQGYAEDGLEEEILALKSQTYHEREVAYAHEALNQHYKRRMELHPSRDIFPADLFFQGDSVKLKPTAESLVGELARLNKERAPWSRLVITCFVKSDDSKSDYARHLAEERARELGLHFIRAGIEPRRVKTKAVITKSPLLIDPDDNPLRYSQAIELTQVDR